MTIITDWTGQKFEVEDDPPEGAKTVPDEAEPTRRLVLRNDVWWEIFTPPHRASLVGRILTALRRRVYS